jgi:hypothetical protein
MADPTTSPIDSHVICLSVDVEWAHPEILADLVRLLDERGLRATFFCTHEGVEVPGHERALHPNFRRHGDTMRRLRGEAGVTLDDWPDTEVYRRVVEITRAFCTEAVGVRAHSLFYESGVLPVYHRAGLRYDSSYFLPLTAGLAPVEKEFDILELPVYYIDHHDLFAHVVDFRLEALHLDRPGMKVLDFHPNLVYLNPRDEAQYLASKTHYSDPEWLRAMRYPGRGVRTLFLELLDHLATRRRPTATLAEIDAAWRSTPGPGLRTMAGGREVAS